jgi:uncharacterized protein
MDVRFLCDLNLGKLVKWLRILGYDTLWDRGNADRGFLRKADETGRIVLTRNRNLRVIGSGRIIVVKADRVEKQICEVLEVLNIKPDQKDRMVRCLLCNTMLKTVTKEEAEGEVPAYVYRNSAYFRKCPICKRIYWSGTHARNVEKILKMRIPTRPL